MGAGEGGRREVVKSFCPDPLIAPFPQLVVVERDEGKGIGMGNGQVQ